MRCSTIGLLSGGGGPLLGGPTPPWPSSGHMPFMAHSPMRDGGIRGRPGLPRVALSPAWPWICWIIFLTTVTRSRGCGILCISSPGGLDGWAIHIPTLRPPSKCTWPSRVCWLSCILWRRLSILLDWSLPGRLLLLGVIWLPFNWWCSSSGIALRCNWA